MNEPNAEQVTRRRVRHDRDRFTSSRQSSAKSCNYVSRAEGTHVAQSAGSRAFRNGARRQRRTIMFTKTLGLFATCALMTLGSAACSQSDAADSQSSAWKANHDNDAGMNQ